MKSKSQDLISQAYSFIISVTKLLLKFRNKIHTYKVLSTLGLGVVTRHCVFPALPAPPPPSHSVVFFISLAFFNAPLIVFCDRLMC